MSRIFSLLDSLHIFLVRVNFHLKLLPRRAQLLSYSPLLLPTLFIFFFSFLFLPILPCIFFCTVYALHCSWWNNKSIVFVTKFSSQWETHIYNIIYNYYWLTPTRFDQRHSKYARWALQIDSKRIILITCSSEHDELALYYQSAHVLENV